MAFIDIDVTKNIKTIDCWMQGEKNAEGVHFDISTWIETYGAGTAYIYIRRNGDETAYFRAMEVTDGVAEWLFSAADTAKAGDGRAQAVYITTDESVVKKTNWYHTVTAESEGDPTGEDPDPYKEMATEVIARMEEAEEELTEEALGEISDAKDAALEDIQDTMFNLAPEFVTTASYSAGDIVLYIGNLYEFTADHAAGAWIGTDARQTTIGGVVADLKEELNDKPNWTVGSAEQLVSDEASQTDVTPYTFRRSGGGLIPFNFTREELSKVVGGTVAWNQLVYSCKQNQSTVTQDGTRYVVTSNGTQVYFGATIYKSNSAIQDVVIGHRYYATVNVENISVDAFSQIYFTGMQMHGGSITAVGKAERLMTAIDIRTALNARTANTLTTTNDSFTISNIMLIDLTQMFGSTIADYIYSLEQATAGAGAEWFRKLFPKPYYEYNAGRLMSVKAAAHETTGKNLFENTGDNTSTTNGITWKKNPDGSVTANGTATADSQYVGVFIADTLYGDLYFNGAYGGSSTTYQVYMWDLETHARCKKWDGTTNSSNAYKNFEQVKIEQGHQIQLTLRVSSGNTVNNVTFYPMICFPTTTDNNFEPYQKHSYALDSDLVLRGRFYLENGQLRADGDEYVADGTVTRKRNLLNLGNINWGYSSDGGYFYASVGDKAVGNFNLICAKYTTTTSESVSGMTDKQIKGNATNYNIYIKDSNYTDAATFKTAMLGVYLDYELATPTTETADPYTAVQICDSDGTEAFTDALVEAGTRDVAIPAGTETTYFEDMAGKLADLPPIPSAPSANGTYTLKAVVSSGSVTYSWQS